MYGGEIMESKKNTLSYKLETLRKNKGLTQKDVADILKVNRTTYTKYETGVTEPNVSSLRKLSEIFGVDMNCLLSDDMEIVYVHDSSMDDEKTREFIKLFNLLSEKDKANLLNQMKKRTEGTK